MSATRTRRFSTVNILVFLVVIALALGVIVAFAMNQRGEVEGIKVVTQRPAPIPVAVDRASYEGQLGLSESFTGLADARRTSRLGFETGGRLTTITVDVGDQVQRGATLARLDTRSLEARLAAAEAQIREADATLGLTNQTVDRQKALADRRLVSTQRYDEALAQADAARARKEALSAQADALRVQIDLSRIRAPFSGVVTERFADEGAIAAPGQPLLELTESSAIEVRIGLPEPMARNMIVGNVYQLEARGAQVPATLRAITGVIDAGQRTVNTVFDVAADAPVASGEVVRLSLERDVEERGFWLPLTAMTEASRGLWSIYVLQPEDDAFLLERRLVEIVHAETDRAFVRGAVEPGDVFVKNGLQRLTPGQRVVPAVGPVASGQ